MASITRDLLRVTKKFLLVTKGTLVCNENKRMYLLIAWLQPKFVQQGFWDPKKWNLRVKNSLVAKEWVGYLKKLIDL